MISYYELLGMIKEDKAPKEIRVHLTPRTSKLYVREDDIDDTFCYVIDEDEETSEDYHYYLAECFLESNMFEKNIEIIEEEMCHKCHKYQAEHNQTYCEFCLGISKEEKKIPEKLIIGVTEYDEIHINNEISTERQVREVADKLNEVLDYLKSKGE